MSDPGQQSLMGLYVRLALVARFVVVASIAGYWRGRGRCVRKRGVADKPADTTPAFSNTSEQPAPASPPLYFFHVHSVGIGAVRRSRTRYRWRLPPASTSTR